MSRQAEPVDYGHSDDLERREFAIGDPVVRTVPAPISAETVTAALNQMTYSKPCTITVEVYKETVKIVPTEIELIYSTETARPTAPPDYRIRGWVLENGATEQKPLRVANVYLHPGDAQTPGWVEAQTAPAPADDEFDPYDTPFRPAGEIGRVIRHAPPNGGTPTP